MKTYSRDQLTPQDLRLLQGLGFVRKLSKDLRDLLLEHDHSLCCRIGQRRRGIGLWTMARLSARQQIQKPNKRRRYKCAEVFTQRALPWQDVM